MFHILFLKNKNNYYLALFRTLFFTAGIKMQKLIKNNKINVEVMVMKRKHQHQRFYVSFHRKKSKYQLNE